MIYASTLQTTTRFSMDYSVDSSRFPFYYPAETKRQRPLMNGLFDAFNLLYAKIEPIFSNLNPSSSNS